MTKPTETFDVFAEFTLDGQGQNFLVTDLSREVAEATKRAWTKAFESAGDGWVVLSNPDGAPNHLRASRISQWKVELVEEGGA